MAKLPIATVATSQNSFRVSKNGLSTENII